MDLLGVISGVVLIFMDGRMGGQLSAVRTAATVTEERDAAAEAKPLLAPTGSAINEDR